MPRIMIVEDSLVAALELEELLCENGYEIAGTAESGSEAILKAEKTAPDLILMDIKLSGKMDGIDVANKLNGKINVPIVFLTGHSESKIVERASRAHPAGFILKPFNGAQIRAAIEVALRNFERDRANSDARKVRETENSSAKTAARAISDIPGITISELKVAQLVREGCRTTEIADRLGLSKHTVSWHRNNIRKKMRLNPKKKNLMSALRAFAK